MKKRPNELKHSKGSPVYQPCEVDMAVEIIRDGGIVAVPTETYYGLAADPENPKAIEKLFAIKQRDFAKPVLLLISRVSQLRQFASSVPPLYEQLIRQYWPGPLTLIFPAHQSVSPLLTAGTGTIGIRLTPNFIARDIIEKLGKPITATSANISGFNAAVSVKQVFDMFGDELDGAVDGGVATSAQPSTVVRCVNNTLCLERQGMITLPFEVTACSKLEK